MSIFRELLNKPFPPSAFLAILAVPALLLLPSCHDSLSQAGKDRRTAAQARQQDKNSFSGELRQLRGSDVAPAEAAAPSGVQYSSLADPYIGPGQGQWTNEDKSFEEDEAALINRRAAARGLNGSLSTKNAGQTLLKDNGLGGGGSSIEPAASTASRYYSDDAPSSTKRLKSTAGLTARVLTTAYTMTGRPYLDGGMTPENGFDDMGFVAYVYSKAGAAVFAKNIKSILAGGKSVSKDQLKPGDILVYRNPRNESQYMLGIYTGNGNFLLSSSRLKHVSETAAFGIDYGPYFVGGRRYFEDPQAAPLSDSMKMAATNGAVKQALASMGDVPKPSYKAASKKRSYKKSSKSRTKSSRSRRK
jgi:cell wall-associated NlpC family hydrolase